MGARITQILKDLDALPDSDQWENMHPDFKEKYNKMLEYMANPSSNSLERTPELAKMDRDLCDLFYELHETNEVDDETEAEKDQEIVTETLTEASNVEYAENEPELEKEQEQEQEQEQKQDEKNEQGEDMKKTETIETEKHTEVEETENINTQEGGTEKHTEENTGSGDQPPVINTNPVVPQNYTDFVTFAADKEVISAKDLIRFKIPEGYWKENKPEFVFGNLKFIKPVAGLLFNCWQVVKI